MSGLIWVQTVGKGLSADDNVIQMFNAKLKYIGLTLACHNL